MSDARNDNGGFPVPVAGEAIRLVRCEHEACGAQTRVRLPGVLPAKVVRRVVCDGCRQPFECDYVLDAGIMAPGGLAPKLPRVWRFLSVPVAAALVIGALLLIQR
jgi:hypothetical protein